MVRPPETQGMQLIHASSVASADRTGTFWSGGSVCQQLGGAALLPVVLLTCRQDQMDASIRKSRKHRALREEAEPASRTMILCDITGSAWIISCVEPFKLFLF